MQYPTISEYVKAIQDAGNNLDKLAHLTPVLDDHGEPYHISGAFAVVFKMQEKSTGKYYTLKCFLKDQKERADDACYQIDDEQNMVGAYSHSTSAKYLDWELLVQSQDKVGKFPVLLADWVDEKSMETFLSMNEDMTTSTIHENFNEAITDEYGVTYSKDGRKLLRSPKELDGNYSIKKDTKIICDWAFEGCTSLRSLVVPESVISIGKCAFYDCSSLSSIVISDSVTSIGERAFWGCSSLSSIVIPNSVTSVGKCAFYDCSSLSSIIIPDSVTSIGDSTFWSCSSLSSLVIPDSVTSIGVCAFRHCSSLSNVVIPDRITSIGCYAFSDCSSLSSIVISVSVTYIGHHAFANCNLSNTLRQELSSRFGDKIFW